MVKYVLFWPLVFTGVLCLIGSLVLIGLLWSGCSVDECEVGDIRCEGSSLQVCSSEGEWLESVNCSSIEPKEFDWVCCINQETCTPKEECK